MLSLSGSTEAAESSVNPHGSTCTLFELLCDVLHTVNQKWMVKDYLAENHQVMFNFIFCMPDANIKRFFFHKYLLV